jgi:hypothetical protein
MHRTVLRTLPHRHGPSSLGATCGSNSKGTFCSAIPDDGYAGRSSQPIRVIGTRMRVISGMSRDCALMAAPGELRGDQVLTGSSELLGRLLGTK